MKLNKAMLLIFMAIFLFSCKSKKFNGGIFLVPSLYQSYNYGQYNSMGELNMRVKFCDCGEFGGHEEKIKIWTEDDSKHFAIYEVYPFKCDSLRFYSRKEPIYTKKLELLSKEKRIVIDCLQWLMYSKAYERSFDGCATSINITNKDSSLVMRVYANESFEEDAYKIFISKVFKVDAANSSFWQ